MCHAQYGPGPAPNRPPLEVGLQVDKQGGYDMYMNFNATVNRMGGGPMISFNSPLWETGTLWPAVSINAGFIDNHTATQAGDFEIIMPWNGVRNINGYNAGWVFDGQRAAFYAPITDYAMNGTPDHIWAETWTTSLGMPTVRCPNGGECVAGTFGGKAGYIRVER